VTKAGEERWLDFTARPIVFEGEPALLGTAFDVTDRTRLKEEARQRESELAHALRVTTLGEMAAGLAHELNQPLSAIVSYARGCVRRLQSGKSQVADLLRAMEQIAAQGLRAGEILQRYRSLIRSGTPKREPSDVNALVREATRFVASEARRNHVKLQLNLATKLPRVDLDGVLIEQVILNLLRNGLDAMNGEGSNELNIQTSATPAGIEVRVRDTGVGIPAAIHERVFDAFFTTKQAGLGMGLSISRSIVEAHGGRLWLTANSDRGVTFHFSLPAAEAASRHAR
jgi:two-component system sensor kinase FixL